MNSLRIAVDAMGGDNGPRVTVPAALDALLQVPNLVVTLVGDKAVIGKQLENKSFDSSRLIIKPASEVVGMDEPPAHALRNKKDSSMRVALNTVKDNEADACVSAGNTGALMVIARYVLKMLSGVDRPAIMSPLPSIKDDVYMLDLGANVSCHAEHLFQFAIMGYEAISAVSTKPRPTVGLLNVGTEAIKGTDQIKQAAAALSKIEGINYYGFVEGDDIFKGTVDVVVCDGFVGNVALKVSEGLAQMMLHYTKKCFNKNILTKLAGLIAKPVLKSLVNTFDPGKYNGGSLLGLQGVVIKSHGSANKAAFTRAILAACSEVKNNVPTRIGESVANKLGEFEVA